MGAVLSNAMKDGGVREGSPETNNSRPQFNFPVEIYDPDNLCDQIVNEDKLHAGSRTPSSASGLTPRASPRPASRSPVLPISNPSSRKSSAVGSMRAKVFVKTGEQEKSGTDANVFVQLEDENGLQTIKLKLDKPLYDDLERGMLDSYNVSLPEGFGRVTKLYMNRDSQGIMDGWFCDYIIVQDPRFSIIKKHRKIKNLLAPGTVTSKHDTEGPKAEYYFPVHRWVSSEKMYLFQEFGCSLPQFDPCRATRIHDLGEKRMVYRYHQKIPGGPAQVERLPTDEKFSDEYFWTFLSEKSKLLTLTKFTQWTTSKWSSFANFAQIFENFKQNLGEPRCVKVWEDDRWFGLQRLMGTDCMVIELCTAIPDKLDVTNSTVCDFLEGFTLEEALEKKKIFMCDLKILDGIVCKDDRVLATPVVLFYLDKLDHLMPVAIQLMQRKAPDNPVFTPNDPASTWLVAKMYYNNAEAQHHQGLTHLGRTHILMEGLCVCTHRNLSPSHPLFKLLAPHFLYLLAINSRGLEKLVSIGGWVDRCMTQGVKGIYQLITKGIKSWRADLHGVPEEDLRNRGVLDPEVLPNFPYRDDVLPLHAIIKKYVSTILEHYYDTKDKILQDTELQQWRREMVTPVENGGVGIQGVPGGEEGFSNVSEVIGIVSTIISTCSLGHASANFQQYDQYAFVPNYPGILMAPPPTVKREYSEKEVLTLLPSKEMTLDIVLISKLLSKRGTNSLGDFEMQYMYCPVGVEAAQELRNDLKRLSLETKIRNVDREYEYEFLDPAYVPNSISV